MRVLHIISGDLWAGAESQVYQTLRSLHSSNFDIDIRCLLFNDGILARRLREVPFQVFVIDENRNNFISMIHAIKHLFEEYRPEILHAHKIKEHFLALVCRKLAKLQAPIVRTLHGLSKVPGHLRWKQRFRSSIVVALEHFLIKYGTDVVIAVSNDLFQQTRDKCVEGSIRQIYNGIDITPYSKIIDKKKLRKKYGAENVFWVVTATRLVETKNLEMLIDVGAALRNTGLNVQISVFGLGPLEQNLRQRIKALHLKELVKLQGFTDRLEEILKAADVFVLCSRHEGLPMALIEAMSAGIPAVCTSVGGMKEVIIDGHNGLLVQLNDVQAMADAIQRLWEDKALRKRLSSNALLTVQERFDVQQTAADLARLYHELPIEFSS